MSRGKAVKFRCSTDLCRQRDQGGIIVEIEPDLTLLEAKRASLPVIAACSCCGGRLPDLHKPLSRGFSWPQGS